MRFQSVRDLLEVAVFLMPGRLSHGNDSDRLASFRMDNDYYAPAQQPQRYKAFFSIIETIVRNGNGNAIEYLLDSSEIESMFEEVQLALGFVPLKFHFSRL